MSDEAEVAGRRFAEAHGLKFIDFIDSPKYSGSLFGQGHDRYVWQEFRGLHEGRLFSFGIFSFNVGRGKYETTYRYGYVRFELLKSFPHMLLDAKSNNKHYAWLRKTPGRFPGGQQTNLEGNFSDTFSIHTLPKDAHLVPYIFTPDLMQQLIVGASKCDIELLNNECYVYLPGLTYENAKGYKILIDTALTLKTALTHRSRYFKD